ncbi:tetratricopeptide repeat protein [Ascidiaceihabitans sp.]|uniref:tetratricopeptide repeat protein n=1 Tax=Ascidiaceihabitans sp. TaxID=1872644 RepID=UPI00329A08A2
MRILFALALMVGPAWAQDCPDPSDHSAELNGLIAKARAAPDEATGREVSSSMWQVWLRAPNEQAQEVLDRGMRQRDVYDFVGAFKEFDTLATYCPTYAEGFNQRAYVQFLQGAFAGALKDLDLALAINPNHVAAQSGRALTLMQLGRIPEARTQMLAALKNNPWLSERALVAKGAPLGPKGEDI